MTPRGRLWFSPSLLPAGQWPSVWFAMTAIADHRQAQIAMFICPFIPDGYAMFVQIGDIGITRINHNNSDDYAYAAFLWSVTESLARDQNASVTKHRTCAGSVASSTPCSSTCDSIQDTVSFPPFDSMIADIFDRQPRQN